MSQARATELADRSAIYWTHGTGAGGQWTVVDDQP